MKLLVTGGAGFIGSNFIRYWMKEHPEDEITNLDLLTYAGNLENLAEIENIPGYRFIKGDIRDAVNVDPLVADTDIIIHFAAESHVDRSILGPEAFVETNIRGTFVLLEAARKHKKRFHHVSTDEVFGALSLETHEKFTENTSYDPHSPYSASKAASDHLVRAYYHTYQVPITITNCSNNFGPFQHPEKFIPRMITDLIDGKTIKVYGDGKYVRDWLYVEDHARAIEKVILKEKNGETYLVGGMSDDVNNLEVAEMLLAYFDEPHFAKASRGDSESRIEFVKDRPGHDRRYAVDWSKIKKELDWQPQHDFKTWLHTTVEWYKNNEAWWRKTKEQAESIYQK